jgi:YidC/Oxa1 family membrane protein insertase
MTQFLTNLLHSIYKLVGNYGLAVILFTILVRVVVFPLDFRSRTGMRKMQKIQPELNKLQQKYANDRVKLQQKQSELMRREKYNPLSGCLPLLIQWPILFAMFAAMRQIAYEQTAAQVFTFLSGETPVYEGWLWIKNLWMPDSLFTSLAPDLNSMRLISGEVWEKMFATFSQTQQTGILANIQAAVPDFAGVLDFTKEGLAATRTVIETALSSMPLYQQEMAIIPGWANVNFILFKVSVFVKHNGYLLLPVLAGITQIVMTQTMPGANQPQQPQQEGQPNMGGFMKYFFPLFTVWICLTSNAAFALYWATANIIALVSNIGLNSYFDKKDAQQALLNEENTVR